MAGPTIVTVGNFDGVHLGHEALVRRARALAGDSGRVVVRAFDPHPRTRLDPPRAPARLSTFTDRRDRLLAIGADEVRALVPDPDLLALSPEQFLDRLRDEHGLDGIVEGPDFRFGHRRRGDIERLRRLGGRDGFRVEVVEPVEIDLSDGTLVVVSSTLLRALLRYGRVGDVARLLGRPYRLIGRVRSGDRRGRTIGVPTANLRTDLLLPGRGVYAGEARTPDGVLHPAAVNIGRRPTVAGDPADTIEAHLVGWDGPLDEYDWTLEIAFLAHLRDEMRFRDVESLAARIRRDVARAARLVETRSASARTRSASARDDPASAFPETRAR